MFSNCSPIPRWPQASQRVVRSDLVVAVDPIGGDFAHLVEQIEQICCAQQFLAIGAVEALDVYLVRLVWLDED